MKGIMPANAVAVVFAASLAACAYYQDGTENRVLAVGIDAYPKLAAINQLEACVSDAQAIANAVAVDTKAVIAGERGAPAVTKAIVLDAIAEATASAPSGGYGVFVFHYSGHGDDSNGGILIMGDSTLQFTSNTTISPAELLTAVAEVPAKVRVVILDSCNSGLFVDEGSGVSTLPGNDHYSLTELIAEAADRYDEGADGDIIVMSAAGAAELSQESSDIDHGYFTMGLLESAKHGDENDDGLVTLSEAYDYASRYVADVFNVQHPYDAYYPRISDSALDIVLFRVSGN